GNGFLLFAIRQPEHGQTANRSILVRNRARCLAASLVALVFKGNQQPFRQLLGLNPDLRNGGRLPKSSFSRWAEREKRIGNATFGVDQSTIGRHCEPESDRIGNCSSPPDQV